MLASWMRGLQIGLVTFKVFLFIRSKRSFPWLPSRRLKEEIKHFRLHAL